MGEAPTSIPAVLERLPEGLTWQYKVSARGGRTRHQWAIVGERGGIHVDAWFSLSSFGDEWIGGIEGHSPIRDSEYRSAEPSNQHCWLLCGPCWRDGSSLQFSEQIAPYLSSPREPMTERDHLLVLSEMLARYNSWLPSAEAVEGNTGKAVAS